MEINQHGEDNVKGVFDSMSKRYEDIKRELASGQTQLISCIES